MKLAVWTLAFAFALIGCGGSRPEITQQFHAKTVFIGDSLTQRWDVGASFLPAPFTNRGVSGQTTADILARFDADVVASSPDIVVILAGTNDVTQRSQSAAISNIQAMIAKSRAANIQAIVGTLPPVAYDLSSHGAAYANYNFNPDVVAYNAALSSLGVPVADYHSALTGADGLPLPGVLTDGMHPSSSGYAKMARTLAPLLR